MIGRVDGCTVRRHRCPVGVVVGARLAALFGAWRDWQQRDHEQRAELRTERMSAAAGLLATSDQMWRATQAADQWAEQMVYFGKAHDHKNQDYAQSQLSRGTASRIRRQAC